MTEYKATPHRAKPETWAFIEESAPRYSFESCLLELRSRVEALEAAQRPTIPECNEDYWRRDALEKLLHAATSYRLNVYSAEELEIFEDRARKVLACWNKKPYSSNAPESSDSLVERVAYAIAGDFPVPIRWKPEARAAILAVADWLDQQELHLAATRLRMEAQ